MCECVYRRRGNRELLKVLKRQRCSSFQEPEEDGGKEEDLKSSYHR